jgi:N-acetylgalactosamine kinase
MPVEIDLKTTFRQVYPDAPEPFLARAPGRVNIIGEHTDYNGLPVLPMTLSQEIVLACAPRAETAPGHARVRVRNADPAFPPAEFDNAAEIPPSPPGSWENYCKAAIGGINAHFKPASHPGMSLLVSGSIPMRAGLSSSSALVVACALAYLRVLGKTLDKDISRIALAGLLAEAEHYVGTRGGGMDQAVILLGGRDCACKIDFFPLRIEQVPLPSDHVFVVCNSLVAANKTGEALHRYNAGPRLSKLICALVEKQAQVEFSDDLRIERLGDLWYGHLCLTHDEVAGLFDRTFPAPATTLQQAAQTLQISTAEIRDRWLGDLIEPPDGFNLQARARHIRTECVRVEAARDALLAGNPQTLGDLMNDSHKSCADDYQISCPELDRLALAARRAGALGARLTGAGFGGCTVNLVPRPRIQTTIAAIEKDYYRGLAPEFTVFPAAPSNPAGYIATP